MSVCLSVRLSVCLEFWAGCTGEIGVQQVVFQRKLVVLCDGVWGGREEGRGREITTEMRYTKVIYCRIYSGTSVKGNSE